MDYKESYEWAEELGEGVKWVWWYFQPRQALDGPHWYVEATNKINGKKHDLWKEGDEKALVGLMDFTGNINSPEEACVYLARCLPQEKGVEKSVIANVPPIKDRVGTPVETLGQQIDKLGRFILGLDCGYPTANEEFPNGMSATEAATEYIKELRVRLKNLEDEKQAKTDSMKPQMKGE